MIKKFIHNLKNMEKDSVNIMIGGFKFSFIICLISSIISLIYILNPISHILYDAGIILFKTGLTFGIISFIYSFIIDNIKRGTDYFN